jgi:hypothetical protein
MPDSNSCGPVRLAVVSELRAEGRPRVSSCIDFRVKDFPHATLSVSVFLISFC